MLIIECWSRLVSHFTSPIVDKFGLKVNKKIPSLLFPGSHRKRVGSVRVLYEYTDSRRRLLNHCIVKNSEAALCGYLSRYQQGRDSTSLIFEVVFSPREDIPLVRGLKIFLLLEVLTQKLGKKYFPQNLWGKQDHI